MGVEAFRTGGTSGGWKLLFGELAEIGEGMIDLEVLACQACGHVELRVPRSR
ncbi:MAG: hypothetical protein ACHQ3P_10400 [Candidatus Limnocylindrales bacterium]